MVVPMPGPPRTRSVRDLMPIGPKRQTFKIRISETFDAEAYAQLEMIQGGALGLNISSIMSTRLTDPPVELLAPNNVVAIGLQE